MQAYTTKTQDATAKHIQYSYPSHVCNLGAFWTQVNAAASLLSTCENIRLAASHFLS